MKIEDLKKRGFKYEIFMDMGLSLIKEYEGTDYHYGIIIAENGSVLLTNYDESDNKNIFCLNFNKEFTEDLLLILSNLKSK